MRRPIGLHRPASAVLWLAESWALWCPGHGWVDVPRDLYLQARD